MGTTADIQIIDRFNVSGRRFSLTHDYNDDSRSVIDEEGKALLRFDSSCGVHQGNKKIGTLSSRDDVWSFEPFSETGLGKFVTSQPLRDYHWVNLQKAEIEVAQHLLM